jgi:predicted Zn-dependent peptidase
MSPVALLLPILLFAPQQKIPVGEHVFHHRPLANGLQALAVDDGEGGTISVFVVYAVGNRAETKTTTGIAHLTEHALFTGTKTTPSGKHDAAVRALKGESNAYTRDDFTAYYAHKVPPTALKQVLRLEADRMRGLTWKPADFLHERERLRVEESHTNKTPEIQLGARRAFALWGGRGYGAGLVDAKGHTQGPKLTLAQTRAFYDRWYRPRNAAVIVVGAKPEAALDAIEQAFGGIPAGPRPPALDPPALGGGSIQLSAALTRPRREWVWVGPSMAETRDRLALLLVAELCEGRKGTDGSPVEVWQGGRMGADLFVIAATGGQAQASVSATWDALKASDWSAAQISKAKARLRDAFTSTPIRSRPYFSLAVELGVLSAYGHSDYATRFAERVDALGAKDVRRVVARWLTPERRVAISYRPTKSVEPLPTDRAGLRKAAEQASGSGDYQRAIHAYEALLKLKPGRIDKVIFRFSLGQLNRRLGRLEEARQQLLAGLKVVEYPALRELLKEVEQDIAAKKSAPTPPASRPASRPAAGTQQPTRGPLSKHKVVGTRGKTPPAWAAQGTKIMGQLEGWRGLPFKRDLLVEFLENDPKGPAGWYELRSKRLVVTLKGSARFGRGTMLHEMFHALQDQHYDLTKVHEQGKTPDADRAITSLIEGEAMLAVQELMDYDFSRHTKIAAKGVLSESRFKKIFHYGQGLQFVLAIRKARGWKGVRQVFAKPPTSTAEVFHPERYLSGWRPLELSKLPKAVVGAGERALSSKPRGEYELRLFLCRDPATRAKAGFFGERMQGDVLHSVRTASNQIRHEWVLAFRGAVHGASPAKGFAEAAQQGLKKVPGALKDAPSGVWLDGDRVTVIWHTSDASSD